MTSPVVHKVEVEIARDLVFRMRLLGLFYTRCCEWKPYSSKRSYVPKNRSPMDVYIPPSLRRVEAYRTDVKMLAHIGGSHECWERAAAPLAHRL